MKLMVILWVDHDTNQKSSNWSYWFSLQIKSSLNILEAQTVLWFENFKVEEYKYVMSLRYR